MATTIGSIVVDLIANTAKFRTDLEASTGVATRAASGIRGAFNTIGGSVTGAIGSMVSFRNVLGTVLGSAGLGLLVKNALSAGDAIVEMSERIGVSTTALQELSYAATLSGASVEDLEQGLRLLNKRLGEAQAGEKAAVETFQRINVDPTRFRDAGEAIGAVADGLLTLGTEAQKTAVQLDLFGRGGGKLAGMLLEGSAGLTRMGAAARDLGLVLDAKLLKEMSRLSDQFDVLTMVIRTNFMRMLTNLGPLLLSVTGKMAEMSRAIRDIVEIYKDIGASNEKASLEELSNRIVDITDKIEKLRAVNKPGSPLIADPKELAILEAQRAALRDLLRIRQAAEANPERNRPRQPTELTLTVTKAQIDAVEEFRRKLLLLAIPDETARRMVELRIEMNKLKDLVPGRAGEIQQIADAMGAIIQQKPAAEALKKFNDQIEALQAEIAELDLTPLGKDIAAALKAMDPAATEDQKNAIRDLVTTLYRQKIATQETGDAAKAVQDDFRGAADAARTLDEADRALGQGIAQEVLTPLESYQTRMRDLERLLLAGKITQEEYERAVVRAGQAMTEQTTGPVDEMIRSLNEQREILGLSAREQAQWNAVIKAAGTPTTEQIEKLREAAGALYDFNQALSDQNVLSSLEDQLRALSLSAREAAIYADQLKLSADASVELRDRTRELSAELYDLRKAQADQAKLQQDISNVVLHTTLSISDALVDMALTGKASFKDLADAIVRDITRIIVKMLVLKAIEMTIAAFGGASANLGTAQGTGTTTTGADITRGATGGIVKARPGGKLMIVGEAGQDEAIIPLSQMDQVGGGGGVEVNIYPPQGSQTETRQRTGPDGKQIRDVIITMVNSGLADGSFDNTLKATHGLRRVGVSR